MTPPPTPANAGNDTPRSGPFKLLSDYPKLESGLNGILEADDWSLHTSVSLIIGSGDIQITEWKDDMGCAWEVIREVHQWIFSSRKAFFDNLRDQMRTDDGKYLLAWPECMMLLKPAHLYRAFLLTLNAYQLKHLSPEATVKGGAQ